MSSIRNIVMLAGLAGAGIGLLSNAVTAQNALGGGNALDNNLNANGSKVNAAAKQENFNERNLIITGDVAGGRGFKGTVGYTASQDFRGYSATNVQFDFRAASAMSSPEYFRQGSTLDEFKLGQTIGATPYFRSLSAQVNPMESSGIKPESLDKTMRTVDRRALATSSGFTLQIAAEAVPVGMTYNKEGQPFLFNVSPARGLYAQEFNQTVSTIGLTSYDAARVRQDQDTEKDKKKPALGQEFNTRFIDLQNDTRLEANSSDATRISADLQPDYARILKSIAERYAQREDVKVEVQPELMNALDADYKKLREQLSGDPSPQNPAKPGEKPAAKPGESNGKPNAKPNAASPMPGERENAAPSRISADKPLKSDTNPLGGPKAENKDHALSTAEYATILKHGQRVDRLSAENQDRLNELIATAEAKLREGDYFWAERRFERALRFAPDHPMAMAGIANSQLGAGLYLSSAYTLQNLFTHQPEMIDTVYTGSLLPKQSDLDEAVAKVRQQLQGDSDHASYGLLLAYIGHQTADRAMVQEGLDAMGKAQPESKLVPLLRGVWLDGDEKPAPPAADSAPKKPAPAELAEPGK